MAEFSIIEQQMLMQDLTDQQKMLFTSQYESVKKDRGTVLILSVLLGTLGVDRFMIGDLGMGLLKLFTFGLCGILWLIDIFTIRRKVDDLNRKNANEIYQGIKIISKSNQDHSNSLGKLDTENKIDKQSVGLTIHGYEEHYAMNPKIKVFRNSSLICEIGHHEQKNIEINEDCVLNFKLSFRTCQIAVRKNIDRHIFLATNRFTGGINAFASSDGNIDSVKKLIKANSVNNIIKSALLILVLGLLTLKLKGVI